VNSKIGEDQSAEDAEDGPPELLVSNSASHPHHLITRHCFFSFKRHFLLIGKYRSLLAAVQIVVHY